MQSWALWRPSWGCKRARAGKNTKNRGRGLSLLPKHAARHSELTMLPHDILADLGVMLVAEVL